MKIAENDIGGGIVLYVRKTLGVTHVTASKNE